MTFHIIALLAKMTKVYIMDDCPDCAAIKNQLDESFTIVDISILQNLKQFLAIRDISPAFDNIRGTKTIGIPCFELEDGTITLNPEDLGLTNSVHSCSLHSRNC